LLTETETKIFINKNDAFVNANGNENVKICSRKRNGKIQNGKNETVKTQNGI